MSRRPASRYVANWFSHGQGEAVLLINGWSASGIAWPTAWLDELATQYRVIRLDNRGTGWSRTAPAPFTIGDLADDARNVLKAAGVRRARVLGLSMGGMIAQELALRHPDVVSRLVLAGTRPPAPAWPDCPTPRCSPTRCASRHRASPLPTTSTGCGPSSPLPASPSPTPR